MADPVVVPVAGRAEPPFEPLADILARTIPFQGGGGAALTVYREGAPVVDLIAGDYRPDSLQLLFSISKVLTALAAARAQQEGLLDLDAPLSEHWPAFAKPSTAAITPRLVLSHRSGLASIDADLSLDELLAGRDEEVIETQEPYWVPGTRHGYHAFTFGTLMGGLFRRALGLSVGEFFADRIARPLGLDLWLGAPAEVLPRLERIEYLPAALTAGRVEWLAGSGIPGSSSGRVQQHTDLYNDPRVAQACWPSTSGTGDARSLAKLLDAVLTTDAVLDAAARRELVATQARGIDAVLGIPMHYGSGVQLPFPQFPLLGPTSFGHEAAGGSAAFADEETGLSVGYTTNRFPAMAGASAGFLALLPTLRHCLAEA